MRSDKYNVRASVARHGQGAMALGLMNGPALRLDRSLIDPWAI